MTWPNDFSTAWWGRRKADFYLELEQEKSISKQHPYLVRRNYFRTQRGELLHFYRLYRGYDLLSFAQLLSVPLNQLLAIEGGQTRMSDLLFFQICQQLCLGQQEFENFLGLMQQRLQKENNWHSLCLNSFRKA